MNFAETGRLVSFDGSPLLGWPPLYPVLLAVVHLATNWSTFAAANALQVIAYVGLSACVSLLFLKMFPEDFALAVAGCVLTDVGVVMVSGFDLLGSDYIHLCLAVLFLLLTAEYVENNSPRHFVALVVTGMLTALERYIGVAAILTGALSILLFAHGSLLQRSIRGLLVMLSAAPAAVWLAVTSPLIQRRAAISLVENFHWFSLSLAEWLLPASTVQAHPVRGLVLVWGSIAGLLAVLYLARRSELPHFSRPVLLFGAIYALALFGSASIAYFNKLGGRFLMPLYIPFVTLLLVCAQAALRLSRGSAPGIHRAAQAGVAGALILAGLLSLRISIPAVIQSHAGDASSENAFNTAQWRANGAIRFWLAHESKEPYALFSNYPDAAAFYTEHTAMASPKQYSGPYGDAEFPLESYTGQLFRPEQDTYLIWIEPNEQGYYYKPSDLGRIADLITFYEGEGGGVYKLSPKTGG
ncbi:MAG TPA: hypothetical protein VMJ64_11975 [Anaerolineales bacterium]|nr:hypothetical protein [Anaerolineales bacterium]